MSIGRKGGSTFENFSMTTPTKIVSEARTSDASGAPLAACSAPAMAAAWESLRSGATYKRKVTSPSTAVNSSWRIFISRCAR